MSNGVKVLTLVYEDGHALTTIYEHDENRADTDTYDEPNRTLKHLESQGWEPMTAITVKKEDGVQEVTIFFKMSDSIPEE